MMKHPRFFYRSFEPSCLQRNCRRFADFKGILLPEILCAHCGSLCSLCSKKNATKTPRHKASSLRLGVVLHLHNKTLPKSVIFAVMFKKQIRVAILDMNEGYVNQGMRCIREILNQYGETNNIDLRWDEFEVRLEKQVPDLSYDIYISSGGPGSPLDSEGSEWESVYFKWLHHVEKWNSDPGNLQKKYVFFICHSYQLVCRHYNLATVSRRKSTAFGVFPIHILPDGENEPVFEGLRDPFYSVDSRDYQVVAPNHNILKERGATILALEKERPHVPLERAIMSIRFNDYMIGTQFHPEADPIGMSMYLQREDRKQIVIQEHGEKKWRSMIDHLNDPDKIRWTYSHIIPNFLDTAINLQISKLAN